MRTIIITPVRNEEKFIHVTLECMVNQTVLPYKWLIVNDGSTDKTEDIVREYERKYSFIQYVSLPNRGYRLPAKGVINTFYEGYKTIKNEKYEIISKFDADLQFPENTLVTIINAFKNDPTLGITGGTRYEKRRHDETYTKVLVPRGFVGGPYKFYRRACFSDINGLIQQHGWDGVDTIKANMKGWKTGEIASLHIIHLKPTGTAEGEGLKKACEKYGKVSYYMGGYTWYFLLRVLGRSIEARNIKVGAYMARGFIDSLIKKEPRETAEFRRFLKKKQRENIIYWLKTILHNKIRISKAE